MQLLLHRLQRQFSKVRSMLECTPLRPTAAAIKLRLACAVITMEGNYCENSGFWANADSKQSTSATIKQTSESTEAQTAVLLDQNSIEPVRLTFTSPAAAQKHSLDHLTMHYARPIPGPRQHPHDSEREAVVEDLAADATPTASMLEGVQTPDLPEQHTGSIGTRSLHTAPAVLQASPWQIARLQQRKNTDMEAVPTATMPFHANALCLQDSKQSHECRCSERLFKLAL